MFGGYVKDSLLKVNESGLRTFTQVMDNGSTNGVFKFRDRHDSKMKAYRTPWMPIAHRIFTEKCSEYKKGGDHECPPMIVRVRETTQGNNKYNLGNRQRQYYVIQQFYDEPRRIGNKTYYYEPRSWFMKWNETPLKFFNRLYSKRDGKRRHLPPIPDDYLNKIEKKIAVQKTGRGVVTIESDVPITKPLPKRGRQVRKTVKDIKEDLTMGGKSKKKEKEKGKGKEIDKDKDRERERAKSPDKKIVDTIKLLIDGQEFDTQIPNNLDSTIIMDEFLRQESLADAELLATVLINSNDRDLTSLIGEDESLLIVDPERVLTGKDLVAIIDKQKPANMSLPDYLSSLNIHSYKGPGSYSFDTDSDLGSEGSDLSSEGSDLGSESGSSDSNPFAGEAGQRYLEGVLSRLKK